MVDIKLLSRLIPLLAILAHLPAWADEGKELFDKQCAGCHTIGGGDSGGPDLKGVAAKRSEAWLTRVIVEPDRLAAEKDTVQLELVKKYGYEMPNLGLGRDDARKIIAYLKGGAPAAAPVAAKPAEEQPAPKGEIAATPELVAQGKALFTGARRLAKGGAPCVGCHAFTYPGVAGGNLAADLTYIYEGMGEQGMRGVLKSLKFPTMKKIYADRPLTDEEITALIAFAGDAAARKGGGEPRLFPAAGAGILVVLLAGLTLYKRRIR
ncbi:MAG: cytochrome c [Geobacteraceae bacterium]|nr:cytochrome c [Geobacteraceae bacterium]